MDCIFHLFATGRLASADEDNKLSIDESISQAIFCAATQSGLIILSVLSMNTYHHTLPSLPLITWSCCTFSVITRHWDEAMRGVCVFAGWREKERCLSVFPFSFFNSIKCRSLPDKCSIWWENKQNKSCLANSKYNEKISENNGLYPIFELLYENIYLNELTNLLKKSE